MGRDKSMAEQDLEHQGWLNEALVREGLPPLTKDVWDDVLEPMNGPSDATDIAKDLAKYHRWALRLDQASMRPTKPRADPVSRDAVEEERLEADPSSWDRYRRRVLGAFDIDGQWCRTRLGLGDLLAPEEVAGYLEKARERENEIGDPHNLAVPIIEGDQAHASHCTVHRGYVATGRVAEMRQPLFDLAVRSQRMREVTGIPLEGAVLYLLSGVVPYWPPASASIESKPFAVVVRVEWPFMEPSEIADLYTRARGRLFAPHASVEDRRAVGKTGLFWAVEVLNFVDERRPWLPWKQILEEWNQAYPDHPHKSVGGLRNSFNNASAQMPEMLPVTAWQAPWRPTPSKSPFDKATIRRAQEGSQRERELRRGQTPGGGEEEA